MKTYAITNAAITLNVGNLTLTPDQVATRQHALKRVSGKPGDNKPAVFEIIAPVMFKVGETIGYDGDVTRVMAEQMVDPHAAKRAAESEAARKRAESDKMASLRQEFSDRADAIREAYAKANAAGEAAQAAHDEAIKASDKDAALAGQARKNAEVAADAAAKAVAEFDRLLAAL